jgi:hypothetical protein
MTMSPQEKALIMEIVRLRRCIAQLCLAAGVPLKEIPGKPENASKDELMLAASRGQRGWSIIRDSAIERIGTLREDNAQLKKQFIDAASVDLSWLDEAVQIAEFNGEM